MVGHAETGGEMLGTITRIAGIVIGIAALLRLATDTGVVEYNVLFQAWMDRLRGIVELGYLVDLLEFWVVLPFLGWLRGLGFDIPPLQPHWESVWIIEALILGAFSRHLMPSASNTIKYVFAALCALLSAVFAGVIDIEDASSVMPFAISFLISPQIFVLAYFTLNSFTEKDFLKEFLDVFILLLAVQLLLLGLVALIYTKIIDLEFLISQYYFNMGEVIFSIYAGLFLVPSIIVLFLTSYDILTVNKEYGIARPYEFDIALDISAITLGAFGIAYFASI